MDNTNELKKVVINRNEHFVFEHKNNKFTIQHADSFGYIFQVFDTGCRCYFPKVEYKKKISTLNKVAKEYGIEFIEGE